MLGQDIGQFLLNAGLLVGALVIGLAAVDLARRALRSRSGANDTAADAFTLQDLREMRDSGALSEAEYAAMRESIVGSFRSAERDAEVPERPDADNDAPPTSPPNRDR